MSHPPAVSADDVWMAQECERVQQKFADLDDDDVTCPWQAAPIAPHQWTVGAFLDERKSADGRTELLVKWHGWNDKFNSWKDKNELELHRKTELMKLYRDFKASRRRVRK